MVRTAVYYAVRTYLLVRIIQKPLHREVPNHPGLFPSPIPGKVDMDLAGEMERAIEVGGR